MYKNLFFIARRSCFYNFFTHMSSSSEEEVNYDCPDEQTPFHDNVSTLRQKIVSFISQKASSLIHYGCKLFQQVVIDKWLHVESDRLNYFKHNQRMFSPELYTDQESGYDGNTSKIILPASFIGSHRYLARLYNDACLLIAKYGKPDLFITFTFNPHWKAITSRLKKGQTYQDRPDLCAQVYIAKFNKFLREIEKEEILGKTIAYTYNTEYQQRGGIHTHIILWNSNETKFNNIDYIDQLISTKIPDKSKNPTLHDLVIKHMIHDPCDDRYSKQDPPKCHNSSHFCSKDFPKIPVEETFIDTENNVHTKRSSKIQVQYKNTFVSDCDVISYNPYLLKRFNCHINIELCRSDATPKYLFKYVYKGFDFVEYDLYKRMKYNFIKWQDICFRNGKLF